MVTLRVETEKYDAMLACDDKNYILYKNNKLKIRGSSLKGKHMAIVSDLFRDALCYAVFNKQNPFAVFEQFQNLSKFSVKDFQIRIYPSKTDYETSSLYSKLVVQLAAASLRTIAGSSLEYVKTTNGYRPVVLFSQQDQIDFAYYKDRLAEIASRILFKPAKSLRKRLDVGQKSLEEFKK